jgi:hypothetical protein
MIMITIVNFVDHMFKKIVNTVRGVSGNSKFVTFKKLNLFFMIKYK